MLLLTLSLSVVCLDPLAASREVGQVDQEDVPLSTTPETIAPESHVHTDKPLATPAVRRIATESKVSIHVFCSHWFVNMSEASALVYVFFPWDFTVSSVTCLYLCTNIFDWHSLFRMLFLFCVKLTQIAPKTFVKNISTANYSTQKYGYLKQLDFACSDFNFEH